LISNIYGSSRVGIKNTNKRVTALAYNIQGSSDIIIPETINPQDPVKRSLGEKQYELSNHLGNVLVTVSDRKLVEGTTGSSATGFRAEVLFASDYYPFGMQMPGREFSQEEYRYGYQGSEKDNELAGEGNMYTTHFRALDTRIGRWLSVDPVTHPFQSPFAAMNNSPIRYNDILGDEVPVTLSRKMRKSLMKDAKESGKSKKEAKELIAQYKPDQLINMFASEYGIGVEYINGNLVYNPDLNVSTDLQVSSTAKRMWINELQKGMVSKHSIQLTFNDKRIDFGSNIEANPGETISTIDLGDFNEDGSFKGFSYNMVNIRAMSFARVVEHEFLGHGVRGLEDDWSASKNPKNRGEFIGAFHQGDVVWFVNQLRTQMGLERRMHYDERNDGELWDSNGDGKNDSVFLYWRFSNGGTVRETYRYTK
jgi:RHS repeat-associated protein